MLQAGKVQGEEASQRVQPRTVPRMVDSYETLTAQGVS